MTEAHIPVVPNIGNQKKTRRNIFENGADEVPLSRKKIDILDIETQKTDEETAAKKEVDTISWLFIVLIVVIIILLIAVIYYVLSKNANKGAVIHPEIVRPMAFASHHAHGPGVGSVAQPQPAEKQPQKDSTTKHNEPARHQLYVEPTEEELNAALSQAQNSSDKVNEEARQKTVTKVDKDQSAKDPDVINVIDMDENIENLIYEDDFSNDDGNIDKADFVEIDEFHSQVINHDK